MVKNILVKDKKYNIIKELGSGLSGTTFLVERNKIKYIIKIIELNSSKIKKDFSQKIAKEIFFYEKFNKFKKEDKDIFSNVIEWEISSNCFELLKFINKSKKSKNCIKILYNFNSETTLFNFLNQNNKISIDLKISFIIQILRFIFVLEKYKFIHGDINPLNILVEKTKEKYFFMNKHKIPYFGFKLILIDFDLINHQSFLNSAYYDLYFDNNKNFKRHIFNEIIITLLDSSLIFDWISLQNKTKDKTKIKINKDFIRNLLKKEKSKYFQIIDKKYKKKFPYIADYTFLLNFTFIDFYLNYPDEFCKYANYDYVIKNNFPKKVINDFLNSNTKNKILKSFLNYFK